MNALDETTPGNQTDVYTLLTAWNKSVKAALEHGGWRPIQGGYGYSRRKPTISVLSLTHNSYPRWSGREVVPPLRGYN